MPQMFAPGLDIKLIAIELNLIIVITNKYAHINCARLLFQSTSCVGQMLWLLAFAKAVLLKVWHGRLTQISMVKSFILKRKRGKLDTKFPDHLIAMRYYECHTIMNH